MHAYCPYSAELWSGIAEAMDWTATADGLGPPPYAIAQTKEWERNAVGVELTEENFCLFEVERAAEEAAPAHV